MVLLSKDANMMINNIVNSSKCYITKKLWEREPAIQRTMKSSKTMKRGIANNFKKHT